MGKLTSIISTVRHGKKDESGQLEEIGRLQSAHRAVDIEHLKGDIILFHSGEQRVRDTIRIIGGNIHKKTIDELVDYLDEKHDLQDYVVPTLHFLKDKKIKSDYFSHWNNDTNEEGLANFIETGIHFADYSRAYNSYEMARNMARVILTQLQFGLLTSEESNTNFVNGSHEPVLMSFLYYVLQDFKPELSPSDFLIKIGGSVDFAEGFDIRVYQQDNAFERATLQFRGFEKEINTDVLQGFLLQ